MTPYSYLLFSNPDLVPDSFNHIAYQTIHTIATPTEVDEEDEVEEGEGGTNTNEGDENNNTNEGSETGNEAAEEFTGRLVAAVNTNPASLNFQQVTIIDLSNGQSVKDVPTYGDALDTELPYNKLFVHAHFVAVDPWRHTLLVTGEHTGNLGVVNTRKNNLMQVISITRPIPGCQPGDVPEPHVHGVSIGKEGTAYVSDEGEDCLYESVTILKR